MENASKALIIAGAILLSILIISLGIFIFTQAQTTINSVNMSEQEIMTFNNKFTQYEGDNVLGVKVNTLFDNIRVNNASYNNGDNTTPICLTIQNVSGVTLTGNDKITGKISGKVNTAKHFKVEMGYDSHGIVNHITVTQND